MSHRLQVIIAFTLVYIVWGSTYLAIGITMREHLAPAVMCAIRFLVAGFLMLLACAALGRKVRITSTEAAKLATIGCLLLVGGNCGLAWAVQWVPTGMTALIVAITPIWFMMLERFVFRGDRLSTQGLLGIMLGFLGIAVLFWPKIIHRETLGLLQLIAAASLLPFSMCWAFGSVLSRHWQLKVDPFSATAWEMLFAGLGNLLVAALTGQLQHVVLSEKAVFALSYLIIFGSWVAYSAYIWLLKYVPTAKVATYAYVNPVVAVFLGWLVLNEPLDIYMLAGAAIIIAAVALVTTAQVHAAPLKNEGLPELESEV